jgi:acyl-CoA synthetase (NDP forming)
MKTLLVAAALVAAIAAPAEARKAKAPAFVGVWCLTETVTNGHDPLTHEYIPNTNTFERPVTADCPAEKRQTIGRHSLDGLEFRYGENRLFVEGSPNRGSKKGRR